MKNHQSRLKKIAGLTLAALSISAVAVSAQTLNLWNVNFAGHEDNATPIPVADGLVLQAGSFGGNQWNNIVAPFRDAYVPDPALSIINANGATPINLTWLEEGALASHSATQPNNVGAELFQGYYGRGQINTTMQLTGLDSGSAYDLYVYFTWGWNEDSVNYSITAGSGSNLDQVLNPSQATANYDDMAEGSNFLIFSNLSPDGDAIHFNFTSSDGGISAFQLVQVPEPSTYAAILGGLFLAFALWRRRK